MFLQALATSFSEMKTESKGMRIQMLGLGISLLVTITMSEGQINTLLAMAWDCFHFTQINVITEEAQHSMDLIALINLADTGIPVNTIYSMDIGYHRDTVEKIRANPVNSENDENMIWIKSYPLKI